MMLHRLISQGVSHRYIGLSCKVTPGIRIFCTLHTTARYITSPPRQKKNHICGSWRMNLRVLSNKFTLIISQTIVAPPFIYHIFLNSSISFILKILIVSVLDGHFTFLCYFYATIYFYYFFLTHFPCSFIHLQSLPSRRHDIHHIFIAQRKRIFTA